MGNQYGPYVMYFLSRLMQKQREAADRSEAGAACSAEPQVRKDTESETEENLFACDETHSRWHKETKIKLLESFCPEGAGLAKKYKHFIIGQSADGNFIGIPGRFLKEEQPAEGKSGFTLWQPIRGGEEFYEDLEELGDERADFLYGYWIAALDEKTLKISEV